MVNRFTEMPALGRPAAEAAARARGAAAGQRIAAADMLSDGASTRQGGLKRDVSIPSAGQPSVRQRACDGFWRGTGVTRPVSQGN